MKLNLLFDQKPCVFAIEVFPPKRESDIEKLYQSLDGMRDIRPDYISVTYSAGGSGGKEYTARISRRLKQNGVEPLAHLTCVDATRDEVTIQLDALRQAGVENILALRGDLLYGSAHGGDFPHASDLMAGIRAYGGFYTVGACYPEGHPESETPAADIERLKAKTEAGAGHLVSQLFFDNGKFFRFLNLLRKKGIHCPVEAGVMPVVRPEQIERTISLSSASLPAAFSKLVSRYADSPAAFYEAGLDYAIRQMRDLIESGVDGIHLYAMNNAAVARRVHEAVSDLL